MLRMFKILFYDYPKYKLTDFYHNFYYDLKEYIFPKDSLNRLCHLRNVIRYTYLHKPVMNCDCGAKIPLNIIFQQYDNVKVVGWKCTNCRRILNTA